MRYNSIGKANVKSEIRGMIAINPRVSVSAVALEYKISRITARRWMEEVNNDRLELLNEIDLKRELAHLQEMKDFYISALTDIHNGICRDYRKNHAVNLGLVKTGWQIEKDMFQLKLDIFSRGTVNNQVNIIGDKVGVAVNLNNSKG
jgi:hypothetical protein